MDPEKKQKRYKRLYDQAADLLTGKEYPVARMATIAALLHHKMEYFFWTGFYLLVKDELIVGPYQGPVACILLERNKGVCWAGINNGETIVVPDVHDFPGHIACDSRSRSEIVVPLRNDDSEIFGVLDVDSKDMASFDEIDARWLEKIVELI
ncbi:MAG: GAF domain-containing protein [Bacteroidales bacterium]|nr:GAF domain-containing protein [Bacteroidales bacterium]